MASQTRFMCALVIIDALKRDLLPDLGADAPEIVWDPTAALLKRIEAGERADGIFAIDYAIDRLVAEGLLDAESRRPVVRAAFGLAVAKDMDVAPPENAEDLKTLLGAVPSIVYSRAGASGIYFENLIDRLGIGDMVRGKSLVIPAGLTGETVRDGAAALAVQQMSELKAVDGIRLLGPLPPDCQQTSDFSTAVFRGSANRKHAEDFIRLLTSPDAARSFSERGLELLF